MFLSIFGFTFIQNKKLNILQLKYLLTRLQTEAFVTHQKIVVDIHDRVVVANGKRYGLSISCMPYRFHINVDGNVSNAFTLYCENYRVVVQLGSGIHTIR